MKLLRSLFLFYLLLETLFFVLVVSWLGFGKAFLLLILCTVFGLLLLRSAAQTTAGFQLIARRLNIASWSKIIDARYVTAGLLFTIPGFFTTALGVLCLISIGASKIFACFNKKSCFSANNNVFEEHSEKTHRVIEGEFWREKEDKSSKT